MIYKNKTRTKHDYKPEFAALRLPCHPVTRYNKIFSRTYLRLQQKNHAPTPTAKKKSHSCCFSCLLSNGGIVASGMPNRIIWEREANAQWLKVRWIWDFGFTLPAGLSDYGVGVSPPIADFIAPKNLIFGLDSDGNSVSIQKGNSALKLEDHNQQIGEEIHPTRLRFGSAAGLPLYKGELAISSTSAVLFFAATTSTTKFITLPTDFLGINLAVWGDQVGGFWRDETGQLTFNQIPI